MTTRTADEIGKEAHMGTLGTETHDRPIPRIDLGDFDRRKAEITEALWAASTDIGFFQVVNHGIPIDHIRRAFAETEAFFALPDSEKARHPLVKKLNAGWECRAQVRPSTGTADQKESYQITRPHMEPLALWPAPQLLPTFRTTMLAFEAEAWAVGMKILSCFADRLGFPSAFFTHAHDPAAPTYQSTLRLLHYFAIDPAQRQSLDLWRAGAHTDFDCLTLLFQQPGQGGLQVCPGKDREARLWTPVDPVEGVITCNIGDMLMRWSDDQLQSTFHRVKTPGPDEYQGSRYSLAFFCQANRDAVIEGPGRKYAPMTAEDYLTWRINANYATY
ncbi:Isopenicillin N synthase [Enhydrobacter aerosaccus]|uniref:2-oxoglutarate-dependent ethylene/succinate-forming enzyme n=1 Tax=Enhydrobacter aerosaccus TaxID=225324 RepID=A0A1T4K3Z1_9HYPH|nr:2OG-Fe(II) oxygenase family protein [Enhydrobacter aerosaccus]SJZ37138.1 Isopenicillin N synthase [Enhydrobacter aerosaccus]